MFTVSEKLVAVYLYSMRICTACVFLVYAHDTPPRVQHFSAFHCVSTSDRYILLYNMSGVIMGVKKNRLSGNHNSHHTTVIREAVIEVE